ncbi:MAG: carbohydrate kinase [Clostridia bacterium]
MSKLICIGECLIDFLPNGEELSYCAKAGGAPANVCACVAKLGGEACYLGKVGKDIFADFLVEKMRACNIDTRFVIRSDEAKTGLAFVTLDKSGDRTFSFYRDPSIDMLLTENEVDQSMFDKGDILHFCSVDLIESPVKYAHKKAIACAMRNDSLVSFDVNVRLPLWKTPDDCKKAIFEFLPFANILKITDEELEFLTNITDEKLAVEKILQAAQHCSLVLLTKGSKGVTVYDKSLESFSFDAVAVKVVDTTGAGDCFIGCVLHKIIADKLPLTLKAIAPAVEFAIFGCGVIIGRKGALEQMPTAKEIADLQAKF